MQYELQLEGASRLQRIHRRLLTAYGSPPATFRLDPVSQLVLSMLGARTRDQDSREAFAMLANRYPEWEGLTQIPSAVLFEAIKNVTFPERKARFIPLALRVIIARRGHLDLNFLSARLVDDALTWLDAVPGVGPKTSAAVLNFSTLHQRALVVDTHYWRVARRVGLISFKTSQTKSSQSLSRLIPASWNADDTEENFVLMKRLGQEHCHHSVPECARCPLQSICPQVHGCLQ